MDTTGSLSFRRSRVDEILCLVFFVPFGILTVVGTPFAIVEMFRRGDHPITIAAMTAFGLLPLMAFGLIMLWLNLGVDRQVTVSRHDIRVHRWIGGGRTVDISSLVQLVQYDKPAELVFLPSAGPPLLVLDTGNLPPGLSAAIGKYVGVSIDHFAEKDPTELRAKYPKNAKESAYAYELDGKRQDGDWEW